jgi:tetratricopeptide (TPR) repeat protein
VTAKTKRNVPSAAGDNRPMIFAVLLLLISVPLLSQLVTDFFLNIDDDLFFTNNPHLRSLSWENLRAIFTTYYGGNYHPVTTVIEAVEYKLFGLKAAGFHAVSLIVHLLNGWLVYRLTAHFSDRFDFRALVTAVFLLHPMHIEPVAWITDKTDLYYSAFFLAALDCYLRYIKNGEKRLLVWTAILFLFSLGSKPAAIAFPLVLFIVDWHFGRGFRSEMLYKSSLLLVSILFAYVTFTSLDAGSKLSSQLMPDYSVVERFFVVNYAFAYYIVAFFLPLSLSALHLAPAELTVWYYIAPLLNAAVIYGVYGSFRTDRMLLSGFLFYAVTIGLVVQIVPSGYNVVAERYSYMPYLGLSMAVASMYVHARQTSSKRANAMRLLAVFSVLLLVFSFRRAAEWKDLATNNRTIADRNPHSAYAQLSAAFQELNAGRVEESLRYAALAEELDSEGAEVQFLKGKIHFALRNNTYDQALQQRERATALAAFQKAKRYGSMQRDLPEFLAILHFESNTMDSAEVYFSELISADTSRNTGYLTNRAVCRYNLNRFEGAIADYTAALAIDSTLGNARAERGICFSRIGRKQEACADLERAVSEGFRDYLTDLQTNCR